MAQVPSNLIPIIITNLPVPVTPASEDTLLVGVYNGVTYKIRAGDLLQVAGVPTSRQVIAGTSLTGGGPLSSNVTLSVAPKGIGTAQLADSGVTPGVYGDGTNVPQLTVDETGRVMAITEVPLSISGYVPTTRQVIAGDGLTGGGALSSNVTLAANYGASAPLTGTGTGSVGTALSLSRSDHRHPAVDLADQTQIDGILPIDQGGTSRSLVMQPGGMIWSGSDGLYVGPAGVSGQVLVSGGTGAPTWGSTVILAPVTAHYFFAGPSSGPATDPTFRAIVNADLPGLGEVTYNGVSVALGGSGTITAVNPYALTIGTGLSGTSYDGSSAVTIAIDSTVATLSGSQTLTNKTISGASNTLTNIGNASLTNSSLTIGTTTISLGATSLTLGGLTSVAVTQDPVSALDLATKQYVDGVAQGLNVKAAVLWSTTANIVLAGLTTQVGGEWTGLLTAGDRILVKNQTLPAENGIYAASATGWTRTADANAWSDLVSAFVFIEDGATLADTGWVCTVNPGGTLGVTPVTWSQFSGAGTYTAGTGLTLTGSQFSLTAPVTAALGGSGLTATPTNGQLLIGNGSGYTLSTLTAGSNITITNSAGGITISSTGGGGGGSGTVTSVGLAMPTQFTVTNSPVTSSGTLTADWNSQTANTVLAGPTTGAASAPTFRALVSGDIPSLNYVSSVGVTAPITSTGGLTPTIGITKASTSTDGYLSGTDWNTFNSKGSGTVTSVAALTLGTTGTDLSSTVANGTTTPVITLNVPTASATNRGALSSTDWSTFNGKQDALVSGTNIKTINGSSILGSGNLTVSAAAGGSDTQIQYNSGGSLAGSSTLTFNSTSGVMNVPALDLDAGTTTRAPLLMVAGTNLTTAAAGAFEYDGTAFYASQANSTRGVLPTEQWVILSSTNTLTSQTAVQPIFDGGGGPTNGAVTLPVGTYQFECLFALTGLSATTGSVGFALGGTATKTQAWSATGFKAGSLTGGNSVITNFNSAANTAVTLSNTSTASSVLVKGVIRVTVTGTVIPQVSMTVAAAAVVQANSYFKISPIGSATVTTVGNWT